MPERAAESPPEVPGRVEPSANTAAGRANFVLVHGAFHTAWCWHAVIARLEAAGHCVMAPDLPTVAKPPVSFGEGGLAACASRVVPLLDVLAAPTILVGHGAGARTAVPAHTGGAGRACCRAAAAAADRAVHRSDALQRPRRRGRAALLRRLRRRPYDLAGVSALDARPRALPARVPARRGPCAVPVDARRAGRRLARCRHTAGARTRGPVVTSE